MYIPLVAEIDIHEDGGEIKTADDVDDLDVSEIEVADEPNGTDDTEDD